MGVNDLINALKDLHIPVMLIGASILFFLIALVGGGVKSVVVEVPLITKGQRKAMFFAAVLLFVLGIFVALMPSSPTTSAPSPYTQAPSCQPFQKITSEAETQFSLCPLNLQTKQGIAVDGYVRDPKWDGWCTLVEAQFNTGSSPQSQVACGPSANVSFHLEDLLASSVRVHLKTVCGNEKVCGKKIGSVGSDVLVTQYP